MMNRPTLASPVSPTTKQNSRRQKLRRSRWRNAVLAAAFAMQTTTKNSTACSLAANRHRRLLIVGLGRVGTQVAEQARDSQQFERIVGTVRRKRSSGSDEENGLENHSMAADGVGINPESIGGPIETCLFDELTSNIVDASTHILFTIPAPDPDARTMIEHVIIPALRCPPPTFTDIRQLEDRGGPHRRWIGVVSTTGVYGNHDGALVTEESECRCDPDSSAGRLLDFEHRWKRFAQEIDSEDTATSWRVRIFRSAGIYGDTRSALHTVFRDGAPLAEKNDKSSSALSMVADSTSLPCDVTNRIHEVDLAASIVSSMLKDVEDDKEASYFRVYNVADDLPESRRVVMEYAARLLHDKGADLSNAGMKDRKPTILDTTKRSRRRVQDRKLVSNARLKEELLPALSSPTYKEGLSQILLHPKAPWQPSVPNVF
jgi:hypothetical protein